MQELIAFLAKSLVENPEAVQVRQEEKGRVVFVALRVAEADVGRVIGKQGQVARAIRELARAAGAKAGKKVVVEIVS